MIASHRSTASRQRFLSLVAAVCLLAAAVHAPELPAQQVAITFDDLPVHGALPPGVTRVQVVTDILAALKAGNTPPVYGFVNAVRMEQEPQTAEVLNLWRKAGYPLGNHTWSHMNLNEASAADWEADLVKDEPALAARMQDEDWHWLRFPYLAEGDTPEKMAAARSLLAARHYRIAGVTLSFEDYLFNEPYVRCEARHDTGAVSRLEADFLRAAREDLMDRRAMAQAALGHQVPLVLLMHVGAFDARMLPRLMKMYTDEGVKFVSLEQAEQDVFYRNDLDPSLPARPDTLEAALAIKQLSVPRHPPQQAALDRLCR